MSSSDTSKEKIDSSSKDLQKLVKEKKASSNNSNVQLNVFSNDGSFLKRFKLLQEQDEKKKVNEALKK